MTAHQCGRGRALADGEGARLGRSGLEAEDWPQRMNEECVVGRARDENKSFYVYQTDCQEAHLSAR